MTSRRLVARGIVAFLLIVGPFSYAAAAAPTTAPAVILLHLPGIGGELRIDHDLTRGLVAGGAADDVIIHDWTGSDRGLNSLGNVGRHRAQAKIVAAKIRAIHRLFPTSRIILTAHSGGAGIAVWALEDLPPDVHVDTLVLLASALSPTYDLSRALAHVDGRAISLYSRYDNLVLGTGTRAFGTIDRVKTDAAGYVGFTMPRTADAAEYAKLTQIPYDSRWMKLGNTGEHIGPMAMPFAAKVLAPLIDGESTVVATASPTSRPAD
ncbi:MAG: hypothetical protein ACTHLZ_01570 [Tepidisphaeraceae bacterium]